MDNAKRYMQSRQKREKAPGYVGHGPTSECRGDTEECVNECLDIDADVFGDDGMFGNFRMVRHNGGSKDYGGYY